MKKIKWYIFTAIIYFLSSTVLAQNPSEQLTKLLSNFHSMSANFQQTAIVKKGTGKSSFGTMALQRPGKFRWEVAQPNHQIIIADGKYLWIYDVDLEQATRQSLTKDPNSPAILLSGSTSGLEKRFQILNIKQAKDTVVFQLKPKKNHDMIQWIELEFVNGKLAQMVVVDNLGQRNRFHFSNVKINPDLASTLFQFHAPKGVDIIKN